MALAHALEDAIPFRGGQRVRVTTNLSELYGSVLIVMAPSPFFTVSRQAVQCFDPATGYVWPFKPSQLERVCVEDAAGLREESFEHPETKNPAKETLAG